MFVGHLAVALGAKRLEPRIPLSAFVAAAFALDLVWPVLVLVGVEVVRVDPGNTQFTSLAFESYPWSHSLVMAGVWGCIAGALILVWKKSTSGAWLIAGTVVSHWLLDAITHRPDLPVWPAGPLVGLGLWNSIPGTLIVEGGLFSLAVLAYVRWTRSRDRLGTWALWLLVFLTSVIWVSQPWSPPPPNAVAVATVALAMWIFPFWADWIERHRTVRGAV